MDYLQNERMHTFPTKYLKSGDFIAKEPTPISHSFKLGHRAMRETTPDELKYYIPVLIGNKRKKNSGVRLSYFL